MMQCGTDQGETKHYNYTIKNNSSHKVELVPYFNNQADYSAKVTISNNESFNLKKDDDPPYYGSLSMYNIFIKPTALQNLTQVEIVFDNTKKVIYEDCRQNGGCESKPKNIFNPIYSDELIETYTITAEDYQNATDCGGNCY